MGIDWMSGDELSQAIPPAYTQFIGEQLLAALPDGVTAACVRAEVQTHLIKTPDDQIAVLLPQFNADSLTTEMVALAQTPNIDHSKVACKTHLSDLNDTLVIRCTLTSASELCPKPATPDSCGLFSHPKEPR
jgi:hypothetical protein